MYHMVKKAISIVLSLMFVLLCISNTIVSSNATSKVYVTDAFNETFTRSDGNYTVNCRLPKLLLDGDDSIQANQNILNRFQNSIEESRSGYDMHEISYSYSINNGILSLVIKDHLVPSTAHYEFLVYNFNLSNNTSLGRDEFLQQNNYDWNKIVEVIKGIYKNNLPKWNQNGSTDQIYYNNSISNSYLNKTELYLDNGKLFAICFWQSLAGSNPNGRYDVFEIEGDIFRNDYDGIHIYSDRTSMSTQVGDNITIGIDVYDNNKPTSDCSGVSLSIENGSVYTLKNTEIKNNRRYFVLKSKSAGNTRITVSDSKTGYIKRFYLYSFNNDTCSYTIRNVPQYRIGNYTCNLNQGNSVFVDDFNVVSYNESTGIANISLSVYNSLGIYGAVEIYDKDAKLQDVAIIKKFKSASTSIKECLWDKTLCLVDDVANDNLFSYHSSVSYKETKITATIPKDGYIRITTDAEGSVPVSLINMFDMLMTGKSIAGELSGFDSKEDIFVEKLSYNMVVNKIYEKLLQSDSKFASKLVKKVGKDVLYSTNATGDYLNSVLNNLQDVDMMKTVKETAWEMGWSIGEDVFEFFSGPIGLMMKGLFTFSKIGNLAVQINDFIRYQGTEYASVSNPALGAMYSSEVIVISDNEEKNTAIRSYRIEINDELFPKLIEMLERRNQKVYRGDKSFFYEIKYIKDGVLSEPDSSVEVNIPIPDGMVPFIATKKVKVYRINDDNSIEEMEYTYKNGYLSFITDHFSYYSIVTENTSTVIVNGKCGDNLTWALDSEGVLSISGTGAMYDYSILSSDNNYAPWKEYGEQIKTVMINEGVTSIGAHAFQDYGKYKTRSDQDSIEEVTLPSTLLHIGEGAFLWCNSLKSITIPDSVTSIDKEAFARCTALSNVVLSNSLTEISEGVFEYCENLKNISFPISVKTLGPSAFSGAGFEKITIPNTIHELSPYSLSSLFLKEVVIKDDIIVDTRVFSQSKNLEKAVFSGSITFSGKANNECGSLFNGCTELKYATIPSVFSFNGKEYPIQSFFNFRDSDKLEIGNITFNDNPTIIDNVVFSKDRKTLLWYHKHLTQKNYVVPNGVENIAWMAFVSNSYLEHVVLPDSLKELGGRVFMNCTSLNNIIIPDGVNELFDFQGCSSLRNIVIPSSVTTMYNHGKADTVTFQGIDELNVYCDNNSYAQSFLSYYDTKDIVYCSFNANGGSVAKSKQAVIPSDKYWTLPSAKKQNAIFDGWYTAKIGGTRITENSIVNSESSFTLYAHWHDSDELFLGDLDADGEIMVTDATYIQRHLVSIPIPFEFNDKAADTDGDGSVTLMDATYIQRWLANLKANDNIGKPIT